MEDGQYPLDRGGHVSRGETAGDCPEVSRVRLGILSRRNWTYKIGAAVVIGRNYGTKTYPLLIQKDIRRFTNIFVMENPIL